MNRLIVDIPADWIYRRSMAEDGAHLLVERRYDMEIHNVYNLRDAYYRKHPNGHYFDHDTLRFFGESYSTMRLLKGTVKIKDIGGEEHECYVLSSLQRKCPGGAKRKYTYFDIHTLEDIIT